jgi:hypothetical protein
MRAHELAGREGDIAVVAEYAGKTGLVTGARRAIGRAVALGLVDADAELTPVRS